jgi:hypothetical protein
MITIKTFKVYKLDGASLGEHTVESFQELVNSGLDHKEESDAIKTGGVRLRNALLGDKGYGYCAGYFVAHRNTHIMSLDEQKIFTDDYFKLAYTRLKKYFEQCKEWDEDVYQDVVMYVYEKMNEQRGINNLEQTIKFKYFRTLIDNGRASARKFIFEDPEVVDDEGTSISYIQQFATESATLDDVENSCLRQVNDMKMSDIIKDELYNQFKESDVDMYLDYVENYRKLRGTRNSGEKKGVNGLALKYNGMCKSTIKNRIRDISKFLKETTEKIMERYNDEQYPDIENLTLKHIIFD